jgi:DNA-binding cell septation regulator SpoVG
MLRKPIAAQSFGNDRWISSDPLDNEIIERLLNMKITEITIRPTNEGLVRAYVDIVFDNCFKVGEIRVIQGLTGLFVSFPAKKQRDGSDRQLAYPANAETRMMFQRVILAEYEKIVGKEDPVPSVRSASERLRALEQLKTDGLINEEEYSTKRKEILGEL